jgi:hypothetical protein
MTRATTCDIVAPMRLLDPYPAFRGAVHDLAAEPTPINVRRYLAASRLLDAASLRAVSPARGRSAQQQARS